MLHAPLELVRDELEANAPFVTEHPRLSLALAGGTGLAAAYCYRRWRRTQGLDRAAALTADVSRGWRAATAATPGPGARPEGCEVLHGQALLLHPPCCLHSSHPAQIRVVKPQTPERLASLLSVLFSSHDSAETIRQLCIGVSAHQKLELLASLVRLLGFESVAVFGDCFDEVRRELAALTLGGGGEGGGGPLHTAAGACLPACKACPTLVPSSPLSPPL